MTARPAIVAAYDALEEAAGGLAKIPGDDDRTNLHPLIRQAAAACGLTFDEAKAALAAYWSTITG